MAVLLAAACAGRVIVCPGFEPVDPASVPIGNFGEVDEGVFRGAQPDEDGFRALASLGVRTVVNLRLHYDDDAEDVPEGIAVVAIPMHAFLDSDPPTDEDVRRFFDVVLDPARRPVFVHCAQGKDRTGTMCALYRMEVQGWTPELAYEEMREFGFHEHYRDLRDYVLAYRPRGFAPPRR